MPDTATSRSDSLAKALAKFDLDKYERAAADQLIRRTQLLRMADVLAKVPGDSVQERIAAIGVSRNTWYSWSNGVMRPNKTQAKRIAELTGIAAEKFQGQR